MAVTCANPNTAEFKALMGKYKNDTLVQLVINDWQSLNNSDEIPSIKEANAIIKNQNKLTLLRKSNLKKKLINNLLNKGYIQEVNGKYKMVAARSQISGYLRINRFSSNVINYVDNNEVTFNEKNIFTSLEYSGKLTKRTKEIIRHLTRMFPDVSVRVMGIRDAQILYEDLNDNLKEIDSDTGKPISFDRVNSFFINGTAILVEGKVTDETAIEEVLHPFVDALFTGNRELFNGLLKEVNSAFPELVAKIDDAYEGHPMKNRDLEKVTQGLTMHFNNQYETKPSKSFLGKVADFIKWFFDVVSNLHKYITGNKLEEEVQEKPQTSKTKEGVEELFNSNPELANQVYQALGFEQELPYAFDTEELEDGIRITAIYDNEVIGYINLFEDSYRDQYRVGSVEVVGGFRNQKVGLNLYKKAIEYVTNKKTVLVPDVQTSAEATKIYKNLEKEGLFEIDRISEQSQDGRYAIEGKSTGVLPKERITPQQKQQAQQVYSQYLDSVFPNSKVKDVVYHGTGKQFDKFEKEYLGKNYGKVSSDATKGFSFALNEEQAIRFSEAKPGVPTVKSVILNVKDPLIRKESQSTTNKIKVDEDYIESLKAVIDEGKEVYESYSEHLRLNLGSLTFEGLQDKLKKELENLKSRKGSKKRVFSEKDAIKNLKSAKKESKDAIIYDYEISDLEVPSKQIVIFEPEQIHILGSKQDIKGFKEFVSKESPVTTAGLSVDAKLSDIAEMLNTEGIVFDINPKIAKTIRYSLSPKLNKVYNNILVHANGVQKFLMTKMLQRGIKYKDEIKVFASTSLVDDAPLVVLDPEAHDYLDFNELVQGKTVEYKSTTAVISGKMSEKDKVDNKVNLEVGNEFGTILEAVLGDIPINEITDSLNYIEPQDAASAYVAFNEFFAPYRDAGIVMIPEVTVYDERTKTAGTIDILMIYPDGKLGIIDLKTSKNPKNKRMEHGPYKGKLAYDAPHPIGKDSLIWKEGKIDKLSNRQKHYLQVNAYRRMLENMGLETSFAEGSVLTLHVHVDIVEDKDGNKSFTGKFNLEKEVEEHPPGQESIFLDIVLPLNVNQARRQQIEKILSEQEDSKVNMNKILGIGEQKPEDSDVVLGSLEYSAISNALMTYQKKLVDKEQAMEMIRSNIYMDKTKEEIKVGIQNAISMVNIALTSTGEVKSKIYTELLRDVLKQIKSFESYIKDPENFHKSEYITYALNFERFLSTFEGLYDIGDSKELNDVQIRLLRQLAGKANEMSGTGIGKNRKEGLVDEAIFNYVRTTVADVSKFEFQEDELDDLLRMGRDMGGIEYQTRDMETARDQLLAIMDKIYKAKYQEFLDKVETSEIVIRNGASKLLKLSDEKDMQKLYEYMLVFKDGKSAGRHVEEIGEKYYDILDELKKGLKDDSGKPKVYADVTNLATASKEDIKKNIELAEKKKKVSDFFNAETRSSMDQPVDGKYHKYTDEFKKARRKHEVYIAQGEHGWWRRKSGISDSEWNKYRLKYFRKLGNERNDPVYAEKIKGKYTGRIVKDVPLFVPKTEYRRIRPESRGENGKRGEDMRSDKYKEIMRPDDQLDALGKARKEFYILYTEKYDELLSMLPRHERDQMAGRLPLIRGKIAQDLKGKGPLFTKLFAKTSRSLNNLFRTTAQNRVLYTDEAGNLIDQLPVFYTGSPRTDESLATVDQSILDLKAGQTDPKTKLRSAEYDKQLALLNGERLMLESKPTLGEINLDLGNGLIKFAGMAEHFQTMGTIEDTLNAFIKVLEKREYQPAEKLVTVGKYAKGKFKAQGTKEGLETNVVRRAKKWMHMVYYDNDEITKGFLDKVASGLIKLSSLSYVAFNPFGNFNNYVLGRVNNGIEAIGQRYYSNKAFQRSTWLWHQRLLPSMVHRLAYSAKTAGKDTYDPEKPMNKYEAIVDLYRMMDLKSDMRESGSEIDRIKKSWVARRLEWGYVLQDAAEWNVQTKVGVAMIVDTIVEHSETKEQKSLYDAYEFDSTTQSLKLDPKWSRVITFDRKHLNKEGNPMPIKHTPFNNKFRYQLRNEIRAVNKQIHGNYAREDRMVMQSSTIGKLGAQFHKWVAPAIRARYGREYFDENLGWMEGRYLSWWKYILHISKSAAKGEIGIKKWNDSYLENYGIEKYGYTNLNDIAKDDTRSYARIVQDNQYAENKLQGVYRTMGELMLLGATVSLNVIFGSLLAMEDDDDDLTKRFKNILRYQTDRTYKEMILFTPTPAGLQQMYQMVKSPIASTRTLGEIGQALESSIFTPMAYVWQDEDTFWEDKDYVYQKGSRAGQLKLKKEWMDAVPILYGIKKWDNYLEMSNFFIK